MFEGVVGIVSQTGLNLLLAIGMGAFLGLRRDIAHEAGARFIGLRTMVLITLLGAMSPLLGAMWPLVGFALLGGFMLLAYGINNFKRDKLGITTELSVLLGYLVGVLCGMGLTEFAVGVTVVLAVVDGYKDSFYSFAKTLTEPEWTGALQLLLLSGVVLPLLPKTPIDPWGVIVPFQVWLLVMLIVGIQFVGYFLAKYLGERGGIPLGGMLGSLVSSTAVTMSLSAQSKTSKRVWPYVAGIILGIAIMQVRVLAEIFLLADSAFFWQAAPVIAAAALGAGLYGGWAMMKAKAERPMGGIHTQEKKAIDLKSPFEIGPALKFGGIFVLVLLGIYAGKTLFGDGGVYAAAALSGTVDIDAIVLSSIESLRLGELLPRTALWAILIANLVNTVIKCVYTGIIGTRAVLKHVCTGVFVSVAFGGIALVVFAF